MFRGGFGNLTLLAISQPLQNVWARDWHQDISLDENLVPVAYIG